MKMSGVYLISIGKLTFSYSKEIDGHQ